MDVFTTSIENVDKIFSSNVKNYKIELTKESCISSLASQKLFRFGDQSVSRLVLKSDSAIELGGPTTTSVSMLLAEYSSKASNINEIIINGNLNLENIEDATIAFGQVVIINGSLITNRDVIKANEIIRSGIYFDGLMLKSQNEIIWYRISKSLLKLGFSIKTLAQGVIFSLLSEIPTIESVKIYFTSDKDNDIRKLSEELSEVKKITKSIKESVWLEKGINIQDGSITHCGSCSDKSTCTNIRKATNKLKGGCSGK
ncbi:hypothetical protein KDN34_06025 [Shewanella yunxiaonensis]|uniref:CO-methylating acetyl-CoA synthase n=1 Tax=Shewanella yunxiaonensis TaxID=2829809 RepID=A0ABX7YXD6_9GAMM|nr:hypothetical protein [Shewanella yunxiaonensis]QUN06991.1 hypothetical protein KDN34_06025 [Shewanella yunxiaonensis]